MIGFYQYDVLNGTTPFLLSNFYSSIQLFIMESGGVEGPLPLTLQITRFLAPSLTAGGIFIALWEPFNQSYHLLKIRFWKNHIIICGLSRKAELLILDHLKQDGAKSRIVVIEPNAEHGSISHMRKKGVVVLEGNAVDEDIDDEHDMVTFDDEVSNDIEAEQRRREVRRSNTFDRDLLCVCHLQ